MRFWAQFAILSLSCGYFPRSKEFSLSRANDILDDSLLFDMGSWAVCLINTRRVSSREELAVLLAYYDSYRVLFCAYRKSVSKQRTRISFLAGVATQIQGVCF